MLRRAVILGFAALFACLMPAAAQAGLQWRKWQDPNEGAFSIDVPAGWRVEGGLVRKAPVDVRLDVLVTSPDGRVQIRIGDAMIPPFVVPNQLMAQAGFGEGRWYSPGYGVNFLVQRYLPASYFMTQWYLPQRVGRVQNVLVRVHGTKARQISQSMSQMGVQVRVDMADMTFQARTNQGRINGYAMIQTKLISMPGSQGATWDVSKMTGYLADPRAEALAARVYSGVVGGFQWNPRWYADQLRVVGASSEIIRRTDNEIAKIIQDVTRNRQQAFDRANKKWDEYIRGTRTVTGPDGRTHEVQDGFDQYIMTPDGQIYGQNHDMADDNYAIGQDGNRYKIE